MEQQEQSQSKFKQRRDQQKESIQKVNKPKFRSFFKSAKESANPLGKKLLTIDQVNNILDNHKIDEDQKKKRIISLIASIHYSHAKRMHKDELMIKINKFLNQNVSLATFDKNHTNTFIREINKVLLKNEIAESLDYEFPEIKVGNEFTFTCPAFTDFVSKKNDIHDQEADHDSNDLEVYNLKVGFVESKFPSWMKVMNNYGYKGVSKGEGKKDEERWYYSFDLEDGGTWGYIVSLDDQCIEIITDPIEASKLVEGEVANLMDLYIFGVASQIGVSAHETVGGGHINIDRAGAFEGDHSRRKLARFLKAFHRDSAFWKKEDPDPINSPFADELGMSQLEIDAWLKMSDDNFLKKLENEVFKKSHPGLDLRRLDPKDVDAKNFKHYQAVNTEHLMDEDYEAQRIEIRRVRAQVDRRKLAMLLERIFRLLDEAGSNYD